MNRDIPFTRDPHRGWMPWGALAPILAIAFIVITALPTEMLLEEFFNFGDKGPTDATGLLAFTLFPFGLLAIVLLAWVRYVERRPLASIGLQWDRRLYCRGALAGMAGILGIVFVCWVLGGYQARDWGVAWGSASSMISIVALLGGFALQAGTEELLFRGWLLSVVSRKFNIATGVIVSSLAFSLVHFSPGQHWLNTLSLFLFSLFCCAWALRAGSILGVMGWHAGWNWMLAVGFDLPLTGIHVGIPALLVKVVPGESVWLTGGAAGPEGTVACVVYFVAGIALARMPRRPYRAAMA